MNNNTPKHTPGPWFFTHDDTGWSMQFDGFEKEYGASVTQERGKPLCLLVGRATTEGENEANGFMLAAAPALYEALKRAERKLTAYIGVCSGDTELTKTILPMVREAIVEAEWKPEVLIEAEPAL